MQQLPVGALAFCSETWRLRSVAVSRHCSFSCQELGRRWWATDITPSFHWWKTVFGGVDSSRGLRAPRCQTWKKFMLKCQNRYWFGIWIDKDTWRCHSICDCVCFLRSNVGVNVFLAALTDEMKWRKDEVTADIQNYKTGRQLKPASGVGTMTEIVLKDTFLLRIRMDPLHPPRSEGVLSANQH